MLNKRILIFDEGSFARVCSALLQNSGYEAKTFSIADAMPSAHHFRKFGLLITSYPFCVPLAGEIRKLGISKIILADDMDENLFTMLKNFNNSYCMMKPLDYEKFRSLVRQVMSRKPARGGSYCLA